MFTHSANTRVPSHTPMAKGQSRTNNQSRPQLNTGEITMNSGCDTSRNGHV